MKLFAFVSSCLLPTFLAQLAQNPISISDGLRKFTNRLLIDLESSSPSNFVFSPYSLHSVFTQLLLGSGGTTRSQLQDVLGVPASDVTANLYRETVNGLRSGPSKLSVYNHLAVAKGFKPKPTYRTKLNAGFSSDIREYDFGTARNESVEQINAKVYNKTEGKIEDLLLEEDVDELTRLLIINAVYFKAVWKQSFDENETFSTLFDSPVTGKLNAAFMNMEAKVRVLEDPENGLEILELPYSDPSKSMLIILPNSTTNDIATRMAGINPSDIRNLPQLDTIVTIPKFNMKYQTYLKQKMKNLGAGDLFSPSADLSGISDSPLVATEGVHQAFIEVNEEGTEAAAATAVVVGLRTARRKRQFFANRPFIFMVYDFDHNVPLFVGKLSDPSNQVLIQAPAPVDISQNGKMGEGSSSEPQLQARPEPTLAECERYLRDFPNALDNHKICEKVRAGGKFLDWLRANRNLCEQSADLYNNFIETNCAGHWCDMAAAEKSQWEEDQRTRCAVVGEANKQFCKNIENKQKTYTELKC